MFELPSAYLQDSWIKKFKVICPFFERNSKASTSMACKSCLNSRCKTTQEDFKHSGSNLYK
ncbi:hypothetical protein BpHYR1_004985 [Brachionus plicatilis]|uniref:Uncharacterized protein n=1 Tax=Brachionus plicatilis TaxID=10195 RepID=A0A3M7S2T3_BRAPC|nr:hypothetical protein BpHYR1_004985 [Brachionus plicatilis]